MQTSTFTDLPPGQNATEASAGENFDISEAANKPVPDPADDYSEDAGGDLGDQDLASEGSAFPRGAMLLAAVALGLLLVRAVSRR